MVIKKKSEKNWEYCIYLGQDENGKKNIKENVVLKPKKNVLKRHIILKIIEMLLKIQT